MFELWTSPHSFLILRKSRKWWLNTIHHLLLLLQTLFGLCGASPWTVTLQRRILMKVIRTVAMVTWRERMKGFDEKWFEGLLHHRRQQRSESRLQCQDWGMRMRMMLAAPLVVSMKAGWRSCRFFTIGLGFIICAFQFYVVLVTLLLFAYVLLLHRSMRCINIVPF